MSEVETDTKSPRKPRGPRAEFTPGDIATLARSNALDAARAKNQGNPSFEKALRVFAGRGTDPDLASELGIQEGVVKLNRAAAVFVSAKGLGGKEGQAVNRTLMRKGETLNADAMVVTLA